MIKQTIMLSLFIFIGCTTADKYDIFKIELYDKYELLDLKEVNDIKTFNKRFWKADSIDNKFKFIARFDFDKGEFSNTSDKGIKLEGQPNCLSFDCSSVGGLRLFLTDNYEILNEDSVRLSESQIADLLKQNILNYGQDPSLSDSPEKAITEVYFNHDQEINKTGHLIKVIADSYTTLIESKKSQTHLTTKQLNENFPLTIVFREKKPQSNLIPTSIDEEIIKELTVDALEGKKK